MDNVNGIWSILMVVFGLGFVIFFHELGHFALAKLNGVKVERFFVGFDPWGLRICQFKVGETVYGIGALPLGGYVSMLGEHTGEVGHEADDPKAIADPRAYPNRPVGARMAILVAGVVMNAILGWACFAGAYLAGGAKEEPAVVGLVMPGSPAYDAGLQAGDEIVAVDGRREVSFGTIKNTSILSGKGQKVRFDVRRPGVSGELHMDVEPRVDPGFLAPMVGVGSSASLILSDDAPYTPPAGLAPGAKPPAGLKGGDRIERAAVAGETLQAISNATELRALSARDREKTLAVEVVHTPPKGEKGGGGTTVVELPPNHFLDLGLRMAIGPVVGVRPDSPAAKAGFLKGDTIVKVDGDAQFDPLRLPDDVFRHAGKPLDVEVKRVDPATKASTTKTLSVTPDDTPPWADTQNSPLALDVAGLGLAYEVRPEVAGVRDGSPAAGKVKPGARILAARLPASAKLAKAESEPKPVNVRFKDASNSWVEAFYTLQAQPLGEVLLSMDGQPEVKLTPVVDPTWFNPDRGLLLQRLTRTLPPQGFARSARRGLDDSLAALMSVPKMIQSLFQGRVSKEGVAGPIRIFGIGRHVANEGSVEFLKFLGMLSLNLAALNILPIPPLDGGQLLVLIGEKVNGKPLPEAIVNKFLMVGLVLILSLMVFVFSQDIWLTVKSFLPGE